MHKTIILILLLAFCTITNAQQIEPKENFSKGIFAVPEGERMVYGAQFMDRFEPVPIIDPLTSDTWGAENTLPRDISNGIEDPDWSYWGGKIVKGEDGKYHMFPCRWSEDSPRGHRTWMYSEIVHAVSEHPLGPYKVIKVLGPGHNPTVYKQKDGSYVVYAFCRTEGRALIWYYRAKSLEGPWAINAYEYDLRERPGAYLQASNFGITSRPDGSFLAVDKKGTMLISKTGTSKWFAVGTGRVYPPNLDELTRYEDPALWYDGIQYHMITHNYPHWEAYYLRSKDGVHWVSEPGLGYGRAEMVYEDGTKNKWYRYERVMVLQDDLGRAMQINFATLDVNKDYDKGSDNHSSKNVCIPLTVGRQLEVLNLELINADTRQIRVKVKAEDGFDPHADMDIKSLRFGASSEVNFGRGCKVKNTEKDGKDLILVFNGKGNGFTKENFAGKLLGKTSSGKLLFGWSQLPGVNYIEPILSAIPPVISSNNKETKIIIEVSNFGQVASDEQAKLEFFIKDEKVGSCVIPSLKPFENTFVSFNTSTVYEQSKKYQVSTKITVNGAVQEYFKSEVEVQCKCQ